MFHFTTYLGFLPVALLLCLGELPLSGAFVQHTIVDAFFSCFLFVRFIAVSTAHILFYMSFVAKVFLPSLFCSIRICIYLGRGALANSSRFSPLIGQVVEQSIVASTDVPFLTNIPWLSNDFKIISNNLSANFNSINRSLNRHNVVKTGIFSERSSPTKC